MMNPPNSYSHLEWALYYRSIGFSIFPVGDYGDYKTPIVEWKELQERLASEEEIKRWWEKWPTANIGVATGKVSNVIVVDVEAGGETKYLTPSVCSKTGGGGYHFFYIYPGVKIKNGVRIKQLTDIRGDGGYAVLPPSMHETGNRYEWAVPPDSAGYAELPESILNILPKQKTQKDWQKIAEGVDEGSRNDTAASYIGKLLHELSPELWESAGWDAAVVFNERNNPPLPLGELRDTFDSIKSREQLRRRSQTDFLSGLTEDFEKRPKEARFKISNYLLQNYSIKTIGGRKERELYLFEDGVYILGENKIKAEIQTLIGAYATSSTKKEIIDQVKDLSLTGREEFNVEPKFINLNNGVLEIDKLILHPHNPQFLFMNKVPVDYIPDADCPQVKKFLTQILEKQDIPVVQEWFGYALYRSYFIKKALINVGERDTGKSTLLRLLARFIGKENVSGVSLQSLGSDKFAAANLYNKHVNIYDDLSFSDIHDNGAFKIATGGGIITGEFKFGDQFQFENYSKLTFSCNKIPNVTDTDDEAYFNRWIVIQFNKIVPNPDKFLIQKIATPEELSGLLNFALEGLQRLLANQEFSYQKDPDEIKTEMLRSGSILANFVYDCLEEEAGAWISKDKMYEALVSYTTQRGLPAFTKENLGKKLHKYAAYIMDGKQLDKDPITGQQKQITGWRNVKIKSSNHNEDEPIRDSRDNSQLL